MFWVVGIRPPQPMVEADAARRHGGTTKTKIISARGPRRIIRVGIVQEVVTRKNTAIRTTSYKFKSIDARAGSGALSIIPSMTIV